MTGLRKFMGFTGYALAAVFFMLVIGYGAFVNGTISFDTPWQRLVIAMVAFAVCFFIVKFIMDRLKCFNKDWVFVVFVGLITALPRMAWVHLIKTVPEIDFLRFHEYTKALIEGNYESYLQIRQVFPHISGFPLLQSFYYRIFGDSVGVGVSFNILCTVLTSVVIYYLVEEMADKSSGRMAGILFALWPNQIMFSSVIASEPLFTLLFVLGFLLFYKAVKAKNNAKMIGYGVVLGAVLSLSQVVRPIATTFIPTLILFLFLYNRGFKATKKYLLRSGVLVVTVFVAFSIGIWGFNGLFADETLVPLGSIKSGMSFFAGTSIEGNGMWTPEVTEILNSTGYDYEASHKEGMRRGFENIKSNPKGFLELTVSKFGTQWAMDDFGLYWSMVNTDPDTDFSLWIKDSWDNRELLYIIAQSYYLAVMLWGLVYSIYLLGKRNLKCSEGTAIIMIIGFTLLHCFTEIQSRYHYSLMPFFIIMAVGGMGIVGRRKYNEDTL